MQCWNLRNATTQEWDQILKITASSSFLLDRRGLSCWTWLCLPYLYHSCLHLPGQSPIYLWKFSEGESHAMSMIKRSAWPHSSIIYVIDVIPHLPDPACSILGNRRKVILTRRSSSNEALTTIIYYSCYDSHARSCLVYFRKPEEDESCATSFDVAHQRLRGVMPVHVAPIFRYVWASSWVTC